jgi:hypothetical protein
MSPKITQMNTDEEGRASSVRQMDQQSLFDLSVFIFFICGDIFFSASLR